MTASITSDEKGIKVDVVNRRKEKEDGKGMIDDHEGNYRSEGGSEEERLSASGTGPSLTLPTMLYRFLV